MIATDAGVPKRPKGQDLSLPIVRGGELSCGLVPSGVRILPPAKNFSLEKKSLQKKAIASQLQKKKKKAVPKKGKKSLGKKLVIG